MANQHSLFRIIRFIILISALALFCLLVSFTSLFQYIELKSYDILLRLSPKRPVAERVIVVGIDDRSIAALGRLPWDRGVICRLLDRINAGGPSAIGVDLFFDLPTNTDADSDLAQSIRRSGKVAFPAALVSTQSATDSRFQSTHWLRSMPSFEPAAVGHANASPDSDGICRRICLSWTAHGQRFWAFGFEIFRLASGLIATLPLEKDDALELGRMTIPARRNDGYQILIHYSDSIATIPVLSVMDVLGDRWNDDIVKGRAVLIGTVSPLEGDQFFTPVSTNGQPMPGILVHANLVNTLLSKSFVTQSSLLLSLALMGLIIGAVLQLMEWSRTPWQWIGTAAVVAAVITAAFLMLWYQHLVLPLPSLLFASLTATAVFHVQRLTTVRTMLQAEIGNLARQLPPGNDEEYLQTVVNRALDQLRRHTKLQFVDLRFLSGEKELIRVTSGTAASSSKEGNGEHLVLADGEFHARLSYPSGIGDRDRQLMEIYCRAIAHYLAVCYRDLEVRRGLPGWKEVIGRGRDVWQLGVLRQIGARWQADESSAQAVLESISGGILLLDFTGLILYRNRTALRLLPFLNSESLDLFDTLQRHGFIDSESARQYPIVLSFPDGAVEIPLHCAEWPRSDLFLRCSSIHTEEKINIGVVVAISDVTDQKRLDAAKGEMVALVSHELRTPLTSIHGFAQQLLRYSPDTERVQHIAETIVRESRRLDQMTRAYLDLTRLEQQTLEPQIKPVDLADIARATAESMRVPAEDKDITIQLEFQESPVIVQGQPELLARAVSNLLGNAIKYSAATSKVAIRVFSVDGTGCVAVKDSGMGIPPEALPHLFEKFYRVKSAASAQVPGSGLGLAYVREVAFQHGGTVSVDSTLHQGSVFELRIPCWRRQ